MKEIKPRGHRQNLRTSGFLWGNERVAKNLSVRDLARLSGVSAGILSLYENGRMIPTTVDYDRVQAVLRAATI